MPTGVGLVPTPWRNTWPRNESVINKVTQLYIKFDDFFILTTDGVRDVVDNNYAVQIIHSFIAKSSNRSTYEAANAICRYARSRWEKLSPMIDDITCVVVKIHR